MIPITILCVGGLKFPGLRETAEQYQLRLGPTVTLREIAASKQRDPAKQAAEENVRLLEALEETEGQVWVLDERGKGMDSVSFAVVLSKARDRGERLTFVLGGAYGLSDAVRKSGKSLRLSEMVLPHELCRVVFLEQLYRAREILKGSGYHH